MDFPPHTGRRKALKFFSTTTQGLQMEWRLYEQCQVSKEVENNYFRLHVLVQQHTETVK